MAVDRRRQPWVDRRFGTHSRSRRLVDGAGSTSEIFRLGYGRAYAQYYYALLEYSIYSELVAAPAHPHALPAGALVGCLWARAGGIGSVAMAALLLALTAVKGGGAIGNQYWRVVGEWTKVLLTKARARKMLHHWQCSWLVKTQLV